MLTEEKRAEIRKTIEEHAAKPETISRLALEKEFFGRVKQLIEARGEERTLWLLANFTNDEQRQNFIDGFDGLRAHGMDPATGNFTK